MMIQEILGWEPKDRLKDYIQFMIGIVGQGFVGNAVYQKWKKYYDVHTYDIDENKSTSTLHNLVMMCDTIFMFTNSYEMGWRL